MSHLHQIDCLKNIKESDIKLLRSDAEKNSKKLKNVLTALKIDSITEINWIRIWSSNQFQVICQSKPHELREYFKSGIWKNDLLLKPHRTMSFEVVNYNSINENHCFFAKYVNNRVTLLLIRNYKSMSDHFAFEIDLEYFSQLSDKMLQALHERLNAAIDLLYTQVIFSHIFKVRHHKFVFYDKRFLNESSVLKAYDLSHTHLDYLQLIATGITSKQIAIHLNKSYRSVEEIMRKMYKKFMCENKQQLVHVAKMISSFQKVSTQT